MKFAARSMKKSREEWLQAAGGLEKVCALLFLVMKDDRKKPIESVALQTHVKTITTKG